MTHLEPGEQVETDMGYRGSAPKYVKCPDGLLADPDLAVKFMVARVRSLQETKNERFENRLYYAPRTVTNFPNTKQFLALLSCLPSTMINKIFFIILLPFSLFVLPFQCHGLLEYQMVFCAIVALTQLSFATNTLFQVAY
jgi:hypothetical protein